MNSSRARAKSDLWVSLRRSYSFQKRSSAENVGMHESIVASMRRFGATLFQCRNNPAPPTIQASDHEGGSLRRHSEYPEGCPLTAGTQSTQSL